MESECWDLLIFYRWTSSMPVRCTIVVMAKGQCESVIILVIIAAKGCCESIVVAARGCCGHAIVIAKVLS